jgi:hypothetical protein
VAIDFPVLCAAIFKINPGNKDAIGLLDNLFEPLLYFLCECVLTSYFNRCILYKVTMVIVNDTS